MQRRYVSVPSMEPPHTNLSVKSERDERLNGPSFGDRLIVWIGGLGPIGLAPASGTVAVALVGVPVVWLLQHVLSVPLWVYTLGTVLFIFLAVWVHERGDRVLGKKDSSRLVLDELAGFFIAMIAVPMTWPLIVAGFFLERVIDIAKIPPARQIEDRVPGGWGVVGDDVVAGLYTLIFLHLVMRLAPQWFGL